MIVRGVIGGSLRGGRSFPIQNFEGSPNPSRPLRPLLWEASKFKNENLLFFEKCTSPNLIISEG